jgi:hypothetical protein
MDGQRKICRYWLNFGLNITTRKPGSWLNERRIQGKIMNTPPRDGQRWDKHEETEILDAYHRGWDTKGIAVRFGRTERAIQLRLEKLGVNEFNGAMEKFMAEEKGKTPKCGVITTFYDKKIFYSGKVHSRAVPWLNCVKWLIDDLNTQEHGGQASQQSKWNHVEKIYKLGEQCDDSWMAYDDFYVLRQKCREQIKLHESKNQECIINEEDNKEDDNNDDDNYQASPSVERRRLLLL